MRRNTVFCEVFRCLSCETPLPGDGEDLLECPHCGSSWPVRDGIPRFFEPSYYWGELSKPDAGEFLRLASERGWQFAVQKRFSGDRDMQISLRDWQRASWLPLLALDAGSQALDIGCGYGAITHSLAQAAGRVFSLEAMPERVEFTRIRLAQEGISNVHLVQASALDPPFRDGMFDLIVVNGVLEWVGEWDHKGHPREVQVGFLKRLCRLLKTDGTLLIGMENRFNYYSAFGAIDHSGLPYTNLMPRRLASWWLRHSTRPHHRTELNPKREYRTYTYSARGYRKLLAESGFPVSTMYWPDPDYNQPHSLIPLSDAAIADWVDTLLSEPTVPRRYGWSQAAKRVLARSGALRLLVPSFVILARRNPLPQGADFWQPLRARIPGLPDVREPLFLLTSHPFGHKNVIRVFDRKTGRIACVIKSTTPAPASALALDRENRYLEIVNERIGSWKGASFRVPRLLGCAQLGAFAYHAESCTPGTPLSRIGFPCTRRKRFEMLRKILPRCVEASIQIGQALRDETRVEEVTPRWLDPPEEVAADPSALTRLRGLLAGCRCDSVQHGDFTLENLLWDGGDSLGVIDWEHLFRGGSPLHDLFTLFVSLILSDDMAGAPQPAPAALRFEAGFFGDCEWTGLFRESLQAARRALSVADCETGPMLVHFLLLRFNQLKARNSALAKDHAGFLAAAVRHEGKLAL